MRHVLIPAAVGALVALMSSHAVSWWVVLLAVPVAAVACIGFLVWADSRPSRPILRKKEL
ncbi:hypothetical protein [Nocardiopsis sp. NRRL B-16309]|uniref:hypothetical protein n=1 Tax=Nocardiopsis sp. NRRL B-16309 TaxID=1519494 RepID=UPI0006AE6F91|nr:hypothetical protein [Nocardiopsis sp. NRRL B-16309]KOX10107.1 hypothetical protein ADL05_25830 [Nocardiopsis sp. NRRL B-16309]